MSDEAVRAIWRPMIEAEDAKRDGRPIMIRARNSAGAYMMPIVVVWRPPGLSNQRETAYAWRSVETNRDMQHLLRSTSGRDADWAEVPDWNADV